MSETLKQTRLFRFDQMAVQVKDKVDPAEANVDRYVGLEHLDPESLKIRRWGETSEVESSKILFKSGDIIFGKRRAYQRKLAVADFDGICSAHAMVLRPKTDVVLEELLPFFMQSDIFMDRAVKISVGGLSPTINWKDLAKEEFALPPLEDQRRIARVLSALELSRVGLQSSLSVTEQIRTRMCIDLRSRNEGCYRDSIASRLALSKAGLWGKEPGLDDRDVIVLRSTDLNQHGQLDMQGGAERSIPERNLNQLELRENDLLLEKSGGGPEQPVGRIGLVETIPNRNAVFICGNFIQFLRIDPSKANAEWLFWMMYGFHAANWTLRHQTQTTGIRNLQTKDYLSEFIPLPSLEIQRDQASEIRQVENARRQLIARIEGAAILKRNIMLFALSGGEVA